MNSLEIQRKISEAQSIMFELSWIWNDIQSAYDASIENGNIPDDHLIQWMANYLSESKPQIELLSEKTQEICGILENAKTTGIEKPPELPESARHLWSVADIAREIFCERNELPRQSSASHIYTKMPDDPHIPVFKAADAGKMLAASWFHKDISEGQFEDEWKERVVDPLSEFARTYEHGEMADCIELIVEALPLERSRNDSAIAVKE